jgi:hypothetical protein
MIHTGSNKIYPLISSIKCNQRLQRRIKFLCFLTFYYPCIIFILPLNENYELSSVPLLKFHLPNIFQSPSSYPHLCLCALHNLVDYLLSLLLCFRSLIHSHCPFCRLSHPSSAPIFHWCSEGVFSLHLSFRQDCEELCNPCFLPRNFSFVLEQSSSVAELDID